MLGLGLGLALGLGLGLGLGFEPFHRSFVSSFSVLRGCPSRWYDLGTTDWLGWQDLITRSRKERILFNVPMQRKLVKALNLFISWSLFIIKLQITFASFRLLYFPF